MPPKQRCALQTGPLLSLGLYYVTESVNCAVYC